MATMSSFCMIYSVHYSLECDLIPPIVCQSVLNTSKTAVCPEYYQFITLPPCPLSAHFLALSNSSTPLYSQLPMLSTLIGVLGDVVFYLFYLLPY